MLRERAAGCAFAVVLWSVFASAQDGAALYAQRCASCHEGGQVRVPARDVIASLPPERIVAALEGGTMRVQGETLTAEQRRAVAAYLSTVRPAAPTAGGAAPVAAPRCEAGSPLRPSAGDWRAWGVTPANDRFQRQPGFSSAQAANLKLKWAFGFDGENAAAANPTIAGDRVSSAADRGGCSRWGWKDGCVHWTFKADGGVRAAITIGEAADATAHPAAYFGDLRATIYSVDAVTGELRWKKKLDGTRAARITGSAVLHGGRLYVPVSSGEEGVGAIATYECCTFRGSIVALIRRPASRCGAPTDHRGGNAARAKNAKGTQLWGPPAPRSGRRRRSIRSRSRSTSRPATPTLPAAPMTDAIVALDLETGAISGATQVTAVTRSPWRAHADTTNCPEKAGRITTSASRRSWSRWRTASG